MSSKPISFVSSAKSASGTSMPAVDPLTLSAWYAPVIARTRGEQSGHRKDRDLVADRFELGARQYRRAAFFNHVGDQRQIECAADAAHLLDRLGRLDEQDIGARARVRLCTAQRFVESERRARIGARDHQEIR